MMQARDATGRKVSLLNDESHARSVPYRTVSQYPSPGELSPYPHTPELLRTNSYDSNNSYDPVSPLTPAVAAFETVRSFDDYSGDKQNYLQRPAYVESIRSNSFNDEDSSNGSSVPERPSKRYPCRYRESHGCEKTFTTSGHASRHSKIHTAEKAVQCTFLGCHKKFTRADNMKQHLETHYKDKARSSSSSKSSSKGSVSSSSKRDSVSSRSTISQGSSRDSQDVHMWDAEPYNAAAEPARMASPPVAWDMSGFGLPIMSRPGAGRTSSGLDALAAIACQEGAA